MALFTRKSNAPAPTGPTIGGPVGDLLEEIGASSQQRRYTAEIGEVRLVLDSGNREVLCVIEVHPATFFNADATAIKARDDDELKVQLAKLGGLLAAFAQVPGRMRLTSVPAPLRYSTKLQGFSVGELTGATLAALKAGIGKPVEAPSTPVVEAAPPPAPAPVAAAAPAAPIIPNRPVATAAPPVATPSATFAPDLSFESYAQGDTLFFSRIAGFSQAAMVVDWKGVVLARHGEGLDLEAMASGIIADFKAWDTRVDGVAQGNKLVVMKGEAPSDVMLCARMEGTALTVLTCSGSTLGRIISILQ